MSYSVEQCKVSCLLVPTLALYLWLTPIVDTSKRTPYRCHTEAVLPSILHSDSWVRELTVVLSHPSILVVLWRENSSTAVQFPSPVSSEAGSAGCPDQTGPQCGAEFCLQTRGGLCIKDSPRGHPSWKLCSPAALERVILQGAFVCVLTCVLGSSYSRLLIVRFAPLYL